MTPDELRERVLEALRRERVLVHPNQCRERLDLRTGDRMVACRAFDEMFSRDSKILCSVLVEWTWDNLTAARTHTCEEDVLGVLFDRSAVLPASEPIDIRVDVTLTAGVDWGANLSMPGEAAWTAWWSMVEREVGPHFPLEYVPLEDGRDAVYAARMNPRVELEADSGGHMTLTRIELQAWSMVAVPRVFDDPEMEEDGPTLTEQLEDLARRIALARAAWKRCLAELRPEGLQPS